MSGSPLAPHRATAAELKERAEAERRGTPYLVYWDADERQVLLELADGIERVTVGRRPDTDLPLSWDSGVSRTHAELLLIGRDWALADDELSQNGSYVNDQRVTGRRRLAHGDILRFGRTSVAFCAPRATALLATTAASDVQAAVNIPARADAACWSSCAGRCSATPPASPGCRPSNRQIAERAVPQPGTPSRRTCGRCPRAFGGRRPCRRTRSAHRAGRSARSR